MTALTIRDVSEDAVRTMRIRAAQAGQSLQAYLRSLIEREAARPTVAEAVEQARRQASADISTDDILAGSEYADRRCRRSPGDRSADPICAVRARRRGHLSASRAHTRKENLGTGSRRRALQLPRVPRRTAGRAPPVASLEEPSCQPVRLRRSVCRLGRSSPRPLDHRRGAGQTQRCSTMRGRSLRRTHLTGGVCGRRAWRVGLEPTKADYEKYGPALRVRYLHRWHGLMPPM